MKTVFATLMAIGLGTSMAAAQEPPPPNIAEILSQRIDTENAVRADVLCLLRELDTFGGVIGGRACDDVRAAGMGDLSNRFDQPELLCVGECR